MSEDPLGNISEQLEESKGAEEESSSNVDKSTKSDNPDKVTKEDKPDKEVPAFPFDDTKQDSLYPREERWDDYDDLEFEVESILRDEGVRNLTGREFDDAILRLASEYPEEIADLVLSARTDDEGS